MSVALDDLLALIAQTLDVPRDRLKSGTRAADLPEWDSLGHLRICLAVTERYGAQIDLDRIAELDSVPALVDFLQTPERS